MPVRKSLAIFLVFFFGIGIFVCANLAVSSKTHDLEVVSQVCPPSGSGAPCSNLIEHMVFWQSVLTAIPSDLSILVISFLLLALLPRLRRVYILAKNSGYTIPPLRRTNHSFFCRHVLQEAFSNGILHSKAF